MRCCEFTGEELYDDGTCTTDSVNILGRCSPFQSLDAWLCPVSHHQLAFCIL